MEYNYNHKKLSLTERLRYFFTCPVKLFEEVTKVNTNEIYLVFLLFFSGMISILNNNLLTKIFGDGAKDHLIDSTLISGKFVDALTEIAMSPFVVAFHGIMSTAIYIFAISLVFNIILKFFSKKVEYVDILNVVAISYTAVILGVLLKTLIMFIANKPIFLDVSQDTGLLMTLYSYLDPFQIWYFLLLIFGFSIVVNISKKKSAMVVLGVWAAALLLVKILT